MSDLPRLSDDRVLAAVERHADVRHEIVRFVHAHPELGHEEHLTADHLASLLESAGVPVQRGLGGMRTAFTATLRGERPGRTVGIVAQYDAVPAVLPGGRISPVHSCGHGPISAAVVSLVLALSTMRDELAGSLVVVGAPADEIHAPASRHRGGGKALSVEAGVWNDIDVALYAHPEFHNTVSTRSLWMRRDLLEAYGARTLRAGIRQKPLEALATLLEGVEAAHPGHVMLEHVDLDGDVEEGTGLSLSASVLYFGASAEEVESHSASLRSRVIDEARWSAGRLVKGVRPDGTITALVADAFSAAGEGFVDDPPPLPFATEFGNISHVVPAALIGVGRPGGWAFHTPSGAAEFSSDEGLEAADRMARVLALAAVRCAAPVPA